MKKWFLRIFFFPWSDMGGTSMTLAFLSSLALLSFILIIVEVLK